MQERLFKNVCFFLPASSHPLRDFATDDEPGLGSEVRLAQGWGNRGLQASWEPLVVGVGVGSHRKRGLLEASQVDRSAREVLSHGHCNHFPSAQTLTWEKPQHSEMES